MPIPRKKNVSIIGSENILSALFEVVFDTLKKAYRSLFGLGRKNANGKTWLTHFYHDLPGDDMGAYHSCDLWYIFGLEQHGWRKFDEKDYAIATELRKRYCAFVRNQDPNCDGYPEWKEKGILTLK